jgi:four helix bundle protein
VSGTYQDLRVWQQAMDLAARVDRATNRSPKHELYGLISQVRQAAVSVASNIAEGKGHRSDREFLHYLYHARGSLFLETQILLGQQLQYTTEVEAAALQSSITAVARSLAGLINALDHEQLAASAH